MAKDAELSDIRMRAWLELICQGGVTCRLWTHNTRRERGRAGNSYAERASVYLDIDLDRDQTLQELPDPFEVKAAEVPVVVCSSGRDVLRSKAKGARHVDVAV